MIVAKYCYDNDIPTLGLCCGQSVMVRALGGKTKKIDNPQKHYDVTGEYVHKISIDKKTQIYDIIKHDEILVNSRHEKAIDICPNLIVSAVCEDGYYEVVEAKNKQFYMAVRFHPESLYKKDKNMNNIFKAFIKACKERKVII